MKLISKFEISQLFPVNICIKYNLNKPRLAMFLAQATHESACLTQFEENLNYSVEGLLTVFPKYFDKDTAKKYGRTQKKAADKQMIANIAYANRMGNGDVESGDGYRHRGMGVFQLTGKDNQIAYANECNPLCIENPDLLLKMPDAIGSALWFWDKKNLNQFSGDILEVTRVINGGFNGISERQALYDAYLKLVLEI